MTTILAERQASILYTLPVRTLAALLLAVILPLQAGPSSSALASDSEGVVRITAVVTDPRGQPVAGLKTADFDLLVDGKPQTLDSVEVAGAAADQPRTFAFLLDEFHTAAEHSTIVRESVLRFVDQYLKPSDFAMVVKPLDSLTTISPTADREAIRAAVSTFEGRKGDYTARTTFERSYMAQAPNAVASARAQIVTSALRTIGMSLSGRKEKAAIVLVSDGFARIRSSREVPANLQTAIRIANRADAPIYAFAPALSPPPAGSTEPADPAWSALTALATQTGGALVTGTSGLDPGLARIARDLNAHYVLSYRAGHGSDGRFHSLQVGVKRKGAQVHARTGYVAPMSAAMKAAAAPAPSAPLRVLRRSALIQSWSGIAPTTPGHAGVLITWEPAAPRVGAEARGRASSIVITASAADGTVLFDAAVAPVGTAGGPDVARFEAPVGPVRVDMKILDAKGVVIDTDARDIVIPAPRPGAPTIYPPAVLRTRSAREFRDVSVNPYAAPVPTREFRRTERLLIRVPALDASGQVTPVSAVLLNRLRQPMRDLPAMPVEHLNTVSQFDLPLASLAPGDYSIRLTATGSGGPVSEFVSFRVGG
jgi:VWFA-related protein